MASVSSIFLLFFLDFFYSNGQHNLIHNHNSEEQFNARHRLSSKIASQAQKS